MRNRVWVCVSEGQEEEGGRPAAGGEAKQSTFYYAYERRFTQPAPRQEKLALSIYSLQGGHDKATRGLGCSVQRGHDVGDPVATRVVATRHVACLFPDLSITYPCISLPTHSKLNQPITHLRHALTRNLQAASSVALRVRSLHPSIIMRVIVIAAFLAGKSRKIAPLPSKPTHSAYIPHVHSHHRGLSVPLEHPQFSPSGTTPSRLPERRGGHGEKVRRLTPPTHPPNPTHISLSHSSHPQRAAPVRRHRPECHGCLGQPPRRFPWRGRRCLPRHQRAQNSRECQGGKRERGGLEAV